MDNQNECKSFTGTWFVSRSPKASVVDLFADGQIKTKLSLTENCSLLIKNVTVKDIGRYFCLPDTSQQNSHHAADLSVIKSKYLRHKVFSFNDLSRLA